MEFTEEYILFLLKNYNLIQSKANRQQTRIFKKSIRRLEKAIDSLDENVKQIVEDIYLNGLTWQETMAKNYISHSTISRARKKALREIAKKMEKECG